MYEVHLRRSDGLDEVRITDVPLPVGEVVSIGGRTWEVTGVSNPAAPSATFRYECTELRSRAADARRRAAGGVARAASAYAHSVALLEDAQALRAEAHQARRNRREQAARRASAGGEIVGSSAPDPDVLDLTP